MIWGIVISLLAVGLIVLCIIAFTTKEFGVISWIVTLVMFVALSFETNKLIYAIEDRSETSDFVSTIMSSLSNYLDLSEESVIISPEGANDIALGCKLLMPQWGKYFTAKDFCGRSTDDIPDIILSKIDKAMSSIVWNMVGWILLTIIVGVVLILITLKTKYRRTYSDYGDCSDGGYNID